MIPYKGDEPRVSPHHYSRHSRVFDVVIEHADMDPISGGLRFAFPVVANSFSQASVAAVDRANAQLRSMKAAVTDANDTCSFPSLMSLREFAPVDITKMETIRWAVTVFKHLDARPSRAERVS